jgi:hypothetical protein
MPSDSRKKFALDMGLTQMETVESLYINGEYSEHSSMHKEGLTSA